MIPQIRRLRIAVSGLGRMGARHAVNFLHHTPRADLVAGVTLYKDYDEMLNHKGLEAVCIATITSVHAEQSIKAIELGRHILCEKPLSMELSLVLDSALAHPDLKVMCGFSRRFDSSYLVAYQSTLDGCIGRPTILRSQTCDNGGIFVDCNIHDIDLALYLEPEIVKHKDIDNGIRVVEFYDRQIAYFYSSRINPPGQHNMTKIIGTTGKLSVNARPASNLLERHLATGIQRNIYKGFFDRFKHAFPIPIDLESSIQAVYISTILQKCLRSGKKIFFNRQGRRVEEASR
ncbi:hypothetical protein BJ170DRAFT_703919 [Xylariales sp. AK1849]|nr:hypothetical protein BJ170DRAFT_703919 [Xylariales sp. AK1849]